MVNKIGFASIHVYPDKMIFNKDEKKGIFFYRDPCKTPNNPLLSSAPNMDYSSLVASLCAQQEVSVEGARGATSTVLSNHDNETSRKFTESIGVSPNDIQVNTYQRVDIDIIPV